MGVSPQASALLNHLNRGCQPASGVYHHVLLCVWVGVNGWTLVRASCVGAIGPCGLQLIISRSNGALPVGRTQTVS
jgi:hypothetical protein